MPLESPVLRDGDAGFIGYASRINPVTLPPGMLQLSENMRLDRGVAVTRKGAKRLADDIAPGTTPLTLPFILNPAPNEPVVQSSYSGGIFAAAVMRSPDESASMEIIVLAGPDRAFTFLTDGSLQYSAAWADGAILADGVEALVTNTGEEIIASKLPASISYPTGPDEIIEPTDKVSMVQAFDRLYLLREADSTRPGWETKYTNTFGITVSSTTATINVTGHGYVAGSRVRIEGSTASAAFDGHEYDILSGGDAPTTDTFKVAVPSGAAPHAVANIKVRRVKPPLYWTGDPATDFVRTPDGIPNVGITFSRLRSTAWASYINNRLIVPAGKQNLLVSDILDPDVYDVYWQSFRVGSGGNDFVVAVHPWVEGSVLVFCRKSIWLAEIEQYPSPDGTSFVTQTGISNLTLLTDEIGCRARRSIATAGQFIYFLSDNGVYRLDSKLDLKLRGDTKPLSDPISDQISDLNSALAANSVGFYFDNRYYLAVPLANASDANNGVFIYSQLNEQWETRDIYGFGVNDFIVSDLNNRRRVLISNRAGKLMLLDELEAGDDSADSTVNIVTPVAGRIITRRYGMGSMSTKRFVRSLADVVLPNSASIIVKANMVNPDVALTLVPGQTNTSGLAEDYTLKQPIRAKAHYAELEFLTTANRPEIRNVSIEAAGPSLPPTETRNAA
jgi:hypothetical protein